MLRWVLAVNENTFFCIGSIYLIFCEEEEENSSHFAGIPNVVPLLKYCMSTYYFSSVSVFHMLYFML